jgi:hypothetical protein
MANSKCKGLFAGLESFDYRLLKRYNKTQNLSRRYNIVDDIAFAESLGIPIGYGYLFDPRLQTAAEMEEQILAIARNPLLPMPIYISVVSPLAGTASFWDDLRDRKLAANLRLRDLDGETIAYSDLSDTPEVLVHFIERMFRRPWTVVGRTGIIIKTLRRILRSRTLNPIQWYIIALANLHCFMWSSASPAQPRTYRAGSEVLDPQYFEVPSDLAEEDRKRYFEPIALTDDSGDPAQWLKRYVPQAGGKAARKRSRTHVPVNAEATTNEIEVHANASIDR